MPTLTMIAACASLLVIGISTFQLSHPNPNEATRLVATNSTDNHAIPQLISDSSAIVPGKTFTLAIQFKIEKGWHLYHPSEDNPGMEPNVKWTLPNGITAENLQFPPSHRIETPAGFEHVFEDELVLLVDFKVDQQVKIDQIISIEAKLKWFCCREDQCRPEQADSKIELPTAANRSPNRNEDFLRWREAVHANEQSKMDH